jgi:anti-sigma factor RsiW
MHVAVWPFAAVAVQVTGVVPTEKVEPEAGEQATVTPGQLSLAVAMKVATAPQVPGALLSVWLAGQVIVGGCVSVTVTVNEQLPAVIIPRLGAVQFTVVVPTGKNVPDAGVQVIVPQSESPVGDI